MRLSANKTIVKTETWNKNLAKGASLEGRYTGQETFIGNYGETTKYIIEGNDGVTYGVYSSASLARQFKNIPEGAYVWITFDGEGTTKNGRTVKLYTVDYDTEA
jgi:hypothetical protein